MLKKTFHISLNIKYLDYRIKKKTWTSENISKFHANIESSQ